MRENYTEFHYNHLTEAASQIDDPEDRARPHGSFPAPTAAAESHIRLRQVIRKPGGSAEPSTVTSTRFAIILCFA